MVLDGWVVPLISIRRGRRETTVRRFVSNRVSSWTDEFFFSAVLMADVFIFEGGGGFEVFWRLRGTWKVLDEKKNERFVRRIF